VTSSTRAKWSEIVRYDRVYLLSVHSTTIPARFTGRDGSVAIVACDKSGTEKLLANAVQLALKLKIVLHFWIDRDFERVGLGKGSFLVMKMTVGLRNEEGDGWVMRRGGGALYNAVAVFGPNREATPPNATKNKIKKRFTFTKNN
jgi:hypothetical protein